MSLLNSISKRLPWFLLVAGALCLAPHSVHAQSSSMFGNRGTTGGSGSSMGLSGSTGLGGSMGLGGSTGLGTGSGFGNTGFGNTGMGNTGFGNSGFGNTANRTGTTGATGSNFVGRNNQAGFTGDQRLSGNRNSSSGNRPNFDLSSLFNNNQNSQNGRGNQGNSQQLSRVRPRVQVAFDYPPPEPQKIVSQVERQFGRMTGQYPALAKLNYEVTGTGTVRISGTVRNEHDRKLAANLLRLEPGVRKVDNQITLQEPPKPE